MSLTVALLSGALVASGQAAISAERKRQLVAEYATCVVKRLRGKAKSVVLSDRESSAAVARWDQVLSPECMPTDDSDGSMTMRTQPILIRFALAQALLEADPSLGLPELAAVPPLEHGTAKASSQTAAFNIAVSRLGECVVRAAPGASTRLVRSQVTGSDETAAFEALKPALSTCLSAGQSFAFSPELLRGAVALNYYRLAKTGEKK